MLGNLLRRTIFRHSASHFLDTNTLTGAFWVERPFHPTPQHHGSEKEAEKILSTKVTNLKVPPGMLRSQPEHASQFSHESRNGLTTNKIITAKLQRKPTNVSLMCAFTLGWPLSLSIITKWKKRPIFHKGNNCWCPHCQVRLPWIEENLSQAVLIQLMLSHKATPPSPFTIKMQAVMSLPLIWALTHISQERIPNCFAYNIRSPFGPYHKCHHMQRRIPECRAE